MFAFPCTVHKTHKSLIQKSKNRKPQITNRQIKLWRKKKQQQRPQRTFNNPKSKNAKIKHPEIETPNITKRGTNNCFKTKAAKITNSQNLKSEHSKIQQSQNPINKSQIGNSPQNQTSTKSNTQSKHPKSPIQESTIQKFS